MLDAAIHKGVAYLQQHQYPNGEFCCYLSGDELMAEWAVPDSTIFPTALIAKSLLSLQEIPVVDEMLTKATGFFEYQSKKGIVWNHYTKWNILYKTTPFDVDDTSCVAVVLKARKSWLMKHNNIPILLANRNKGGLFYTWFTPRLSLVKSKQFWKLVYPQLLKPLANYIFWKKNSCKRNDVDGVVNANALLYLGEQDYTKPVIDYLIGIVRNGTEKTCDRWYPNPLTFYYIIARNYFSGIQKFEEVRQTVIDKIVGQSQPDGRIGKTELDTALAVCSLLYWRSGSLELDKAVQFLIDAQGENGNWKRSFYYYGPRHEVGWGSEEFTTGFCLEALAEYKKCGNRHKNSNPF